MKISLTDFVDFVSKSGTPKQTKVAEVKSRNDYHPALDFWKPLRDGIVEHHRAGKSAKDLDKILSAVTDKRKLDRYRECLAGYKKFLGKKTVKWFEPERKTEKLSSLEIIVNPELGLTIDGTSYILKLYFKQEPISKLRMDLIQFFMQHSLGKSVRKGIQFAVVDVQRGKMFSQKPVSRNYLPLLTGEAASFAAIWETLD